MTILPLLGAGALLLAPATALAQRPTTSVTVTHADLDLSTRQGRATLDHRIARAARDACGYTSQHDLVGRNRLRDCREEARAAATAKRNQLAAAARPVEVASGQ